VVSGDVEIGEETRVLYGAVVTSEGAPVRVGARCVIMEHAVIRGAGGRDERFPVAIGDHVLVGPHTHLSGCSIGPNSFIATGSMVFNGARIGIDTEGKSRAQQYHEMMERYTRGLAAHREDRVLRDGGQP